MSISIDGTTSAVSPSQRWWTRAAVVLVSVLALGLGLVPGFGPTAAFAATTNIENFRFTANVNTGQSDLRPGGHVRYDIEAFNTESGFPYTTSVLHVHGVTAPAGFTYRSAGGDLKDLGTHGQGNNFHGGKPGNPLVGRQGGRDGWISFNIPQNAQGGATYQAGIGTQLKTVPKWFFKTNVVSFKLPAVSSTTSVTVDSAVARVDDPVDLTARVAATSGTNKPTGTMKFEADGQSESVAVVDGVATTEMTFDTAGSKNVTATFAPSSGSQWRASSGSATVDVQAEATQTALTLDQVEVVAGESITATALITPADAVGDVEFTVAGQTQTVPVAAGSATAQFQLEAAGTETVTATFTPANPERYTSSSDSQTVDAVEQLSTSTSLAFSADTARVGEDVTITATVTPSAAGGAVTFTSEGQEHTVPVDDGVATTTHTFGETGDFPIAATFTPEDSVRYAVSSDSQTVSVAAEATQTALTLDQVEVVAGESISATALITPADAVGDVEFTVAGQTQTVPVAAGAATAQFQLEAAGTETVTATFTPANPERYTSSSDSQTVDATAEATETEVLVSPIPARVGEATTITAAITPAEASGSVAFTVADQTYQATVENGVATAAHTFGEVGDFPITATFTPANSARYAASTGAATATVAAAAVIETGVTIDPVAASIGAPATLTARVTPTDTEGTVTFEVDGKEYTAAVVDGVATTTHTFSEAGEYLVRASFRPADTDRYTSSNGEATVVVEAASDSAGSLGSIGSLGDFGSLSTLLGSIG